MIDLATWLMGRIAEDEAEARYWTCDCAIEGFPLRHGSRCEERVKAECESKRRIVEIHRPHDYGDLIACEVCADLSGEVEPWPCPTLRYLAMPYADRDGYDPEWRP